MDVSLGPEYASDLFPSRILLIYLHHETEQCQNFISTSIAQFY